MTQETKTETQEQNNEDIIGNMQVVEGEQVDISQFVGKYYAIEKVTLIPSQFGGKSLKIETVSIDKTLPFDLRASNIYSLNVKDSNIIEDSKLHNFMEKMKVKNPLELVGKEVQAIKLLKGKKEYLSF